MSYTSLFCHIVFSTKARKPLLSDDLLRRAVRYMGGIMREQNGRLLEGGGAPDHVHLAAMASPAVALSRFVGTTKSNCTGWIHKTCPDMSSFAWQEGYSAFSVSPSMLPRLKKYIREQKTHHAKMTFQEELIALLEKHGVEYDERYISA